MVTSSVMSCGAKYGSGLDDQYLTGSISISPSAEALRVIKERLLGGVEGLGIRALWDWEPLRSRGFILLSDDSVKYSDLKYLMYTSFL